jgi:cyclase
MSVRIIPKLDIKGPNLVKGIHFEGLRVMGKPEDFAGYYYHNGADELIYMDAVASLYGRNSLLEIVERTSREIFIPLCVGGGLRSVEDIRAVLRAGADKVSLNTAAIENPELIRTASRVFGSSTVVVSIEAIRHPAGKYEAFVEYGRQETGVDVFEWAQRAEALGAGELVVTSINQEGTGQGFDLELTRRIAESVSIPVIAAGGAGSMEHVAQVIQEGRADAVSIASLLHYNYVRRQEYSAEQFAAEGNVEFLQGRRGGTGFSKIQETSLPELKAYLVEQGFDVRQQLIPESAHRASRDDGLMEVKE